MRTNVFIYKFVNFIYDFVLLLQKLNEIITLLEHVIWVTEICALWLQSQLSLTALVWELCYSSVDWNLLCSLRLALNSQPSCFTLLIIGMSYLPCSASSSIPKEGNRLHFAGPEIHYSCFMLTPSCCGISDMKVLWARVNPEGLCSSSCGGASIIILLISLREAKSRGGLQVEMWCLQQCALPQKAHFPGALPREQCIVLRQRVLRAENCCVQEWFSWAVDCSHLILTWWWLLLL